MILVDTSVWIDHLRRPDDLLTHLLKQSRVLTHPFVIGEIALGYLRNRGRILATLADLPGVIVASDEEVLSFIDTAALVGSGVGYLDAHLLASVKLTSGARMWTRDKKVGAIAATSGLAMAMN